MCRELAPYEVRYAKTLCTPERLRIVLVKD
jgi:hypothetical protein